MKIAVFVLACCLGYVASESCSAMTDCSLTTCGSYFELHCVDSACLCLSPATGATCQHDKDCEHADHDHEHCMFSGDLEWKCTRGSCRCVN